MLFTKKHLNNLHLFTISTLTCVVSFSMDKHNVAFTGISTFELNTTLQYNIISTVREFECKCELHHSPIRHCSICYMDERTTWITEPMSGS